MTGISLTFFTRGCEKENGDGNGECDGKGETHSLHHNFACKFGGVITDDHRTNLNQGNPDGVIGARELVEFDVIFVHLKNGNLFVARIMQVPRIQLQGSGK